MLIDEYDAPLLDSNSDALLQQQLRNEMRHAGDGREEQGTEAR